MKKTKSVKIAELLPEGLSEASINKIAELVQSTITEGIEEAKKELNSKVFGFLELKKQEIKEAALRELNEENEVFRNAELMKNLKAYLAMELNESDINNALSEVKDENTELKEELKTLVIEMKKLIIDNTNLMNTTKVLNDKNIKLNKKEKKLTEQTLQLKEQVAKPFKSSEKAIIINDNTEKLKDKIHNPWLNEEVMKIMPKAKK